jgi:hypothetical protein
MTRSFDIPTEGGRTTIVHWRQASVYRGDADFHDSTWKISSCSIHYEASSLFKVPDPVQGGALGVVLPHGFA